VKAARDTVQRGLWSVLDASDAILGKVDPLTPPRRLMNVGSNGFTRSDFNAIGRELFRYLVEVGGLTPNDKVLDVGCGVGRMAIPLTSYLSAAGSYDGFDIIAESIDYCTHKYSPRFPNFHFYHTDIYNTAYNPGGKGASHEYRFPFGDETFSFVVLTSVFTHMLSPGLENYLAEIERVLTKGGRCFITYFVLDHESEQLLLSNKSAMAFSYPIDHGKSTDAINPEAATAYDERYIRDLYLKLGLRIAEPIRYGSWSGKSTNVGFQDIILGVKTGRPSAPA
jgi:SAM-dependent methyltransferase